MKKVLMALALAVCLVWSGGAQASELLSPADAHAAITKNGAGTVVDVRSSREFAGGHVPGAINLDMSGPEFRELLEKGDKEGEYLIYCQSGKRSAAAAAVLEKAGFKNIGQIDGGFSAWSRAGLPVEK